MISIGKSTLRKVNLILLKKLSQEENLTKDLKRRNIRKLNLKSFLDFEKTTKERFS